MYIWHHLWTSIALGIVLYPVFGWWSACVIIGGFVIDVDHYITYIILEHDFSLKRSVDFYLGDGWRKHAPVLNIFHTSEFFMLLLVLSFVHVSFLTIFSGYLLHIVLDFIHETLHDERGERAGSIVGWFLAHRKTG